MEKTLRVESMMCEKCVKRVTRALEAVEGVERAEVTLDDKLAKVTLADDVSDEALVAAVAAIDHNAEMA